MSTKKAEAAVVTESVVGPKGELILDLAIQYSIGVISNIGNKGHRRDDVELKGHEELLLIDPRVPDRTRVKRIVNGETGEIVGVLRRPNGMRRFEGKIDNIDVVGLESGLYRTMIIPRAELESRGYTFRQSKTVDELIEAERARLAMTK